MSNLESVSAWTNRVRGRLEGGGGGRVKNKSPHVGRNVRSFPCGKGKKSGEIREGTNNIRVRKEIEGGGEPF